MQPCCETLLRRISLAYNIPIEDLHALTNSNIQCSWIYNRKTKNNNKGDKCTNNCLEGFVFCPKHHKQASSYKLDAIICNCFSDDGHYATKSTYIPSIGVVEMKQTKDTKQVTLLRGDPSKMELLMLED